MALNQSSLHLFTFFFHLGVPIFHSGFALGILFASFIAKKVLQEDFILFFLGSTALDEFWRPIIASLIIFLYSEFSASSFLSQCLQIILYYI